MPFYAVSRGRRVGIYMTWSEARDQVDGFSRARYKKFESQGIAVKWMQACGVHISSTDPVFGAVPRGAVPPSHPAPQRTAPYEKSGEGPLRASGPAAPTPPPPPEAIPLPDGKLLRPPRPEETLKCPSCDRYHRECMGSSQDAFCSWGCAGCPACRVRPGPWPESKLKEMDWRGPPVPHPDEAWIIIVPKGELPHIMKRKDLTHAMCLKKIMNESQDSAEDGERTVVKSEPVSDPEW